MSKKLYFFTNSYPYGFGELWKTNELSVLVNFFDKITVVPFSYAGNINAVPPIKGVEYHEPIFSNGILYPRTYLICLKLIFSKHLHLFLMEAKKEKVFYSKGRLFKWLRASYKMLKIAGNSSIKNIISTADNNTIFYFYWGREMCEILPLLKVNCFKIVSRFHRYDLYRYANGGYIPYQYFQIKMLDYACACSEDGKRELVSYFPGFKNKIITKRLGTISKGKSVMSEDSILRIVSCSGLVKVKRVDIIARALQYLDINIEWVHIGDGPLMADIKALVAQSKNPRINFKFLGHITGEKVIEYYSNHRTDLFINVSESEGVPVAVMEALAAGIPVMATDVGGARELVDDKVGMLIPKDILPEVLAANIVSFYRLFDAEKKQLRQNAFNRYLEKCDANSLSKDFASFLLAD